MLKISKILPALLAVCLLLASCGGGGEEPKPLSTGDNAQNGPAAEKDDGTGTEETKAPGIAISETLIYDSEKVAITVKGIGDGWTGKDILLLVENKSNQNISVSCSDVVVNGVTMHGSMYIDVAAGKKSNGTLTLYSDDLENAGIEQIATVRTCDASVFDTDSYETLEGIKLFIVTSLGEDFVQELDESGDVLFENSGIAVIAKVMEDEFYGKTLLLYVKNSGTADVIVEAENISVNGFTVDAWMYDLVCGGTSRFCELDLWGSGLEENGIEKIEDVTFNINIIDANSYNRIAQSGEIQVFIAE